MLAFWNNFLFCLRKIWMTFLIVNREVLNKIFQAFVPTNLSGLQLD